MVATPWPRDTRPSVWPWTTFARGYAACPAGRSVRKEGAVDEEARLLSLLERLRKLGLSEHRLKEAGVGPPQLALLAHIFRHPGCRLKGLAEGLGVHPPTASVAVRHLEEKGLMERWPDPEDRRAVRLFLTPQGSALYRRAERFRKEEAKRLLGGLSSEDQAALLELLERALVRAEYDDARLGG